MGHASSSASPPRPPPAPASPDASSRGPQRRYLTPDALLQLATPELQHTPWSLGLPSASAAAPAPLHHAVSLHNSVNLDKSSVRVVPLNGRLFLEFTFDADVRCEARVFFVGLEGPPPPPGSRDAAAPLTAHLVCKAPQSGARHVFPRGMRQRFSQVRGARVGGGGGSGSGSSSGGNGGGGGGSGDEYAGRVEAPEGGAPDCLDPSCYALEELTHAPGGGGGGGGGGIPASMYPVIIALRALGEDDTPALPVALQVTFCTLVRRGEGVWDVRPLSQQVQVGEARYVIRDFYGGGGEAAPAEPGAAAPPDSSAVLVDDRSLLHGAECVVCLSEPRTTAVLPCRHLCLCAECASQLAFQTNRCPICRGPCAALLSLAVELSPIAVLSSVTAAATARSSAGPRTRTTKSRSSQRSATARPS
jgi:hypothetical protein